jgi:hypothetical protein
MEVMFEDDSMEEELQEFILNMTPYPNGEGNWSSDSGVLSNPQGVIVPQLEPVVDKKNWSPRFPSLLE